MFESTAATATLGVVSGIVLLLVGFVLGRRSRPTIDTRPEGLIDDAEKSRVLDLLKQLAEWTNQYSGDVSEYQSKLVELDQTLEASGSQGDNRFVMLLKQVIDNNEQLQDRLEAAENQLEKQTLQIESYLSEARTDGLTGLANRRAFDKKLDELFLTYRGGGRGFTITLIDIDKFKTINDTYGHPVGDQVLREVSGILRGALQDAEIVARFGGEEFAILMSLPLNLAAARMNEVRSQIEAHVVKSDEHEIDVTASMGVSQPYEDVVVAPVLRRADEALYAAKNVGRNKVYYHDGDRPTLVGAPEVAR